MTENLSSGATASATFMASAPARSDDPAWAHGQVVAGSKNSTICLHCNKRMNGGGITRLKYHLAGIQGQVEACKKVPADVKWQMKQLVNDLIKEQEKRKRQRFEIGSYCGESLMEEDEHDEFATLNSSNDTSHSKGKKSMEKQNPWSKKGLQSYSAPCTTPGSQPSIKSAMASKEIADNARLAVARWWYDANVPFDGSNSIYYQQMIDSIAAAGPGFKGPSFHDLRGPLLKDTVHDIKCYLSGIKADWETYGCSVMADGWTNQIQEPIINFLVYSPRGTMFLKSVDTSGLRKDKETLLELFDQVVEEIGSENIVQFITDNDASYKAAGKALQQRYGTFFWSPCAAHCIDLMLENFSDPRYFPMIDATIKRARNITKFIYNHAWVLSLMRKDFTNGRDLCRPAVTRFATHFLSLQCLLRFKKELRQMFTSNMWLESSYAKSSAGKVIAVIILQDTEFWANCQHIVMVSEPLLRVLRLVDSEEKPAMGYLYEAMDKAKEAIITRMKRKVTLYGPYVRVIDARWDKQLHSPLHAAGCFLNPAIYFRPSFTKQKEVTRGLLTTITRLVPEFDVQDKISAQLEEYKKSAGDFGMSLAIRQREKLSPVAWWEQFGNHTPELQKFAIRVLSQCCSATGCERNWSIFKFMQSKRRNRLEHKRLNDLVFVRYNLKLRERSMSKGKMTLDPISLDHIDLLDEWICEEPSLLDGDDFNWETIEAPFASLKLEDEEMNYVDDETDIDAIQVAEAPPGFNALEDDSSYDPPPDQDPFLYVNDEL